MTDLANWEVQWQKWWKCESISSQQNMGGNVGPACSSNALQCRNGERRPQDGPTARSVAQVIFFVSFAAKTQRVGGSLYIERCIALSGWGKIKNKPNWTVGVQRLEGCHFSRFANITNGLSSNGTKFYFIFLMLILCVCVCVYIVFGWIILCQLCLPNLVGF